MSIRSLSKVTGEVEDEEAFETLFREYYKPLHAYSYTILRNNNAAEEVVQSVFLKLWEKRTEINFHTSVKSYLYKSTHNYALNYIRDQKTRYKHTQDSFVQNQKWENQAMNDEHYNEELKEQIRKALNELPEKCRTVFQMSRFEDLKYREIADRLNISVKTVEVHMGKALRILRKNLAEYLPLFYILLSSIL